LRSAGISQAQFASCNDDRHCARFTSPRGANMPCARLLDLFERERATSNKTPLDA
jgi:hypothetical protein